MKKEFGLAYVSTNILKFPSHSCIDEVSYYTSLTRHLVTLSEKIKLDNDN